MASKRRPSWLCPLEWPPNVPHVIVPLPSRFKTRPFKEAAGLLIAELERWDCRKIRITANVPPTSNGRSAPNGADGVAVTFEKRVDRQWVGNAMGSDTYTFAWENAVSLAKCIEAFRTIDRHNPKQVGAVALAGFRALPPTSEEAPARPWREVLSIPTVKLDDTDMLILARSRYRSLKSKLHPDKHDNDSGPWQEVELAWASARLELGDT